MKLLLTPLLALAAALVAPSAWARSATGDRVLVVVEPQLNKQHYSTLFSGLENRGFKLTYTGPKEEQNPLTYYDERQFDHLIMLCPTTSGEPNTASHHSLIQTLINHCLNVAYASTLKPVALIDALATHGVNALFVLSSDISEAHRDLAREFDIEFEERETGLTDHFHNLGSHTDVLLNGGALDAEVPSTIARPLRKPIAYSGVVHSVGRNPLLIPVLHGSDTSYSAELAELDPEELEMTKSSRILTSRSAGLVTAFQSRTNSRVAWIGSERMLRNDWLGNDSYGNKQLVEDVSSWVFQERGVLKVLGTEHHRQAEQDQREVYRIKDEVTFAIDIAEHETTVNGSSSWGAFDTNDIQLDFTMLDPHVRTALTPAGPAPTGLGSRFQTTFTVPDRHGVFKFVVNYWRPGYTFLHTEDKCSVVPFRHDEYPRFIQGAWPFYASAMSVSVVFLLFAAIWLWTSKETAVVAVGQKKKAQ